MRVVDFHFYWSHLPDVYDWLALECSLTLVIVRSCGVKIALDTLAKIDLQTRAALQSVGGVSLIGMDFKISAVFRRS